MAQEISNSVAHFVCLEEDGIIQLSLHNGSLAEGFVDRVLLKPPVGKGRPEV
jgi:hypothetical protein